MIKFCALLSLTLCYAIGAQSQVVTIDSCQRWVRENYPALKQQSLIEESKSLLLSNAEKGNLPQVSFAAYSTIQSEATSISLKELGASFEPQRKDQHRVYAELSQPLTDFINVNKEKALHRNNGDVEIQRNEAELYGIKEKVNSLFFGILLVDAKIRQLATLKSDLQDILKSIKTNVVNGSALQSSLDQVQSEIISCDQRIEDNLGTRRAYVGMLSLLANKSFDEKTVFQTPSFIEQGSSILRPELNLLSLQQKGIDIQKKYMVNRFVPKVNLFVQVGYGAPGLNIMDNSPQRYYYTGVRVSWNLSNLYTYSADRRLLVNNKKSLEVQRDAFMLNTNILLIQQDQEILKLRKIIQLDDQAIDSKNRIKKSAQVQYSNGIITLTDLLQKVNAEDQAKQDKDMHEIRLIFEQYKAKTIRGL